MDIKEIIIKKGIIKKKKVEKKRQMGENHSFIFRETICNNKDIPKI